MVSTNHFTKSYIEMNKKSKKIGSKRRVLVRALGPERSKMIFSWVLRKKLKNKIMEIPTELHKCAHVLIILPQDRFELVFQLENLLSILSLYKTRKITLLCPSQNSSFFRGLQGITVQEYTTEEMQLYSFQWKTLIKEFEGVFDICINLQKEENLDLLYLVGLCKIPIRIGYGQAGDYPFHNIRLKNSPDPNSNVSERNKIIANYLGAPGKKRFEWGVSKTTSEEVRQLLKDLKMVKGAFLTGIDLNSLETYCGKEWCEDLISTLQQHATGQFYIFGGIEGKNPDMGDDAFSIMPPLSVPRTAALIKQTDLIITSKSVLLGLAQLSSCPIAAVLNNEDFSRFCRENSRITQISFSRHQKDEALTQITELFKQLSSLAKVKKVMSHHKR